MRSAPPSSPATLTFPSPTEALNALLARVEPVGMESVSLEHARGRVLAEPILADRDSPPCDVSSMDGYAVRLADLARGELEVAGEALIGQAPPAMAREKVLRVFTGSPVPPGAEAVVRREDVIENGGRIRWQGASTPAPGTYIRRRGENLQRGEQVLASGALLGPAVIAALATFGVARPRVRRRVRIAIIVTGNELRQVGDQPDAWQIRNANGPSLHAMSAACGWADVAEPLHVPDEPERIRTTLAEAVQRADAILLTGGVSMGQYDHVPDAVRSVGGEVVFHKLPIRPGKPVLAAAGPGGQVIFGLPGNPVSVMVTARRIAAGALRRLAGFTEACPPVPAVRLTDADDETLALRWFRPVRLTGPGQAELVSTRGSGDMVSAARGDGFVEVPPGESGQGPWPFYAWEL